MGKGGEGEQELPPLREQIKFYSSLCLGTTACLSAFGFLFLIPFVVDPSISTLMADFDPDPVTCMTVDHEYLIGMRHCNWSSCREGCTAAPTRCHHIMVQYINKPYKNGSKVPDIDDESLWNVSNTELYVNAKGCGYPPRVNCTIFADEFGQRGKTFPCYYSRVIPRLVVIDYAWSDSFYPLVAALVVPTFLFGVSVGVLSFWYCPSCNPELEEEDDEEDEEEDEYQAGCTSPDESRCTSPSPLTRIRHSSSSSLKARLRK